VEKAPGELPGETEILAAGNTVLLGTSVISGTAKVMMCAPGRITELGEIADTLLAKARPPPLSRDPSFRAPHHAHDHPPCSICPFW